MFPIENYEITRLQIDRSKIPLEIIERNAGSNSFETKVEQRSPLKLVIHPSRRVITTRIREARRGFRE